MVDAVAEEVMGTGQSSPLPLLAAAGSNPDLVAALHQHAARFLVVGGLAVHFHDPERVPDDLDLLIEPTVENARLVLSALDSLRISPLIPDFAERLGGARRAQVMLKFLGYYADLITRPDLDFPLHWAAAGDYQALIGRTPVRVAAPSTLLLCLAGSMEVKHAADVERLGRVIARGL